MPGSEKCQTWVWFFFVQNVGASCVLFIPDLSYFYFPGDSGEASILLGGLGVKLSAREKRPQADLRGRSPAVWGQQSSQSPSLCV